jgi:2,3-bisphosphoglycerate-dependent phosphoglycerate mutase
MKILLFLLLFLNAGQLFAQDLTIILVRHAEKDASPSMVRADPDLSPEGKQRALKFFEVVKKYNPQQIFTTNYRRTRLTVDPLASNQNEKYRMWVEAYNPAEQDTFAQKLLGLKVKTVVVVGHSNTIPQLANLLLKQQKYKDLDDSVYNKIFIIRVKGAKVTDEVIEY